MLLDQNARDRAAHDVHRNISIEAGAGTGKTTLLTQRYLETLRARNLTPAHIVAITFTEASAQELMDRLGKKLPQADLLSAPISTIHGFCARLLRAFPALAGVRPQFEILHTLTLDIFLSRCFQNWFENTLEDQSSLLTSLFGLGLGQDRLEELCRQVYHARDASGFETVSSQAASPADFFKPFAAKFISFADTLAQRTDVDPLTHSEVLGRLRAHVSQLLMTPGELLERDLLKTLHIPKSLVGLGFKKEVFLDAQAYKAAKDDWEALVEAWTLWGQAYREGLAGHLVRLALSFLTAVEERKAQEGKLDFQDLLLKARDLVTHSKEAWQTFKGLYPVYLVDEFQDTDRVQADLIWRLCRRSFEQPDLEEGALFIVGDPKQSIYRFRGADLSIYKALTQHFEAHDQHLYIQQNFRSRAALLNWVNACFSRVMGEGYRPLLTDPTKDTTPCVSYLELDGAQILESKEAQRLEAQALATWIERAHHRGIPFEDMAILYPFRSGLDQLESCLRDNHVPFSVMGGSYFYKRREVLDMLKLLKACLYPKSRLAQVAALKTGYLAVDDAELFELMRESPPKPPQHPALEVLKQASLAAAYRPLSATLHHLLELTWAMATLKQRRHGEQAVANLEKLRRLIETYERDVGHSPQGTLQWLLSQEAREDTEEEAQVGEAGRGVSLMTIHQSKGLEFPVVLLYQLSSAGTNRPEPVLRDAHSGLLTLGLGSADERIATPSYERCKDQDQLSELEERQRLLYVACTRAKSHLVIPRLRLKSENKRSFSQLLSQGLEAGAEFAQPCPLETTSTFTQAPVGIDAAPQSHSDHYQAFKTDYEQRPLRYVHSRVSVHPSEYGEDLSKQDDQALSLQQRGLGPAFHRVFQYQPWRENFPLSEACRWVCHALSLSSRSAQELLDLASKTLAHPVWQEVRHAEHVATEVPFSLREEESLLEGLMDLVYFSKGTWHILDYKTDRHTSEELSGLVQRYTPQLKTYMKAFEHIEASKRTTLHSGALSHEGDANPDEAIALRGPVKGALFFVRSGTLVPIA